MIPEAAGDLAGLLLRLEQQRAELKKKYIARFGQALDTGRRPATPSAVHSPIRSCRAAPF